MIHPKALLDSCAALVQRLLLWEHPADAVVARFVREQRNLGPRERAVVTDTAYAVLRYKLALEHCAASGSGAMHRRLAILGFAADTRLLQTATSPTEWAWWQQCQAELAPLLALNPSDAPSSPPPGPLQHNLPDWLANALQQQLGDDWPPLAASLLTSAPLDVRINSMLGKRDAIAQELAQALTNPSQAIAATPYSPWGLRLSGKPALGKLEVFRRGAIEVQDEGSQLLALLLDARRGELVVDFCAGAGGKTLAIGASMRNTGRLYAWDTSAHRLQALQPRLQRSGLSNVHPAALAHERDERVLRLLGKADRVLVDAPCSGLGTLRRNPDLKWRQTPKTIASYALQQAAILRSAARLVKPGGRLVYATCSLLRQENEDIAHAFSAEYRNEFAIQPVGPLLTALKVPLAPSLCAGTTTDSDTSGQETGQDFLRLWPHRHQTDGFFAAVWTRK